eukprot:scaffold26098_cov32-Tisochrysis_lutea.AAC.2
MRPETHWSVRESVCPVVFSGSLSVVYRCTLDSSSLVSLPEGKVLCRSNNLLRFFTLGPLGNNAHGRPN